MKPLVQADPGDMRPISLGGSASPAYAIAKTICSGVIGMARTRTPIALNTALPIAAPTGPWAASPAPTEGHSGREIRAISTSGTSENVRIG